MIKVLKENECLSLKEIMEKFVGKANYTGICKSVKQLEKYHEIKSLTLNIPAARKFYGKNIKTKIKLYFIEE